MGNWKRPKQDQVDHRLAYGLNHSRFLDKSRARNGRQYWRPSVSAWEKKFCFMVGTIPWSRFVEAKKHAFESESMARWNDSGCAEAFQSAKTRFWLDIKGFPCNIPLPDPESFVDQIDWDSSTDHEALFGLESAAAAAAATDTEDEEGEGHGRENSDHHYSPPIHDIVPTGWDFDINEYDYISGARPRVLTGLIVGED